MRRALIAVAIVLVLAAVGVLALGGVITVWDSDSGEDVSVRRIDSSATIVFVLAAIALVAAVVGLWTRRALWIATVSAALAGLSALLIRRTVLSRVDDVNAFIAAEGSASGIRNQVTRAVSGNITNVDPDIISVGWAIGAGLLLAAAASAACSIWLGFRRDGPE